MTPDSFVLDTAAIEHHLSVAVAAMNLAGHEVSEGTVALGRVVLERDLTELGPAIGDILASTAAMAGGTGDGSAARTVFATWDDYFIDGTFMLENVPGITDRRLFGWFEEVAAFLRLVELSIRPVVGGFDYGHMRQVHRRTFADVFPWAGTERVGPAMTKRGPNVVDPSGLPMNYAYYRGSEIASAAAEQYEALRAERFLEGLPRAKFVSRLAYHWATLNVIHSFREGNTRTQMMYFKQLTERAGHTFDHTKFLPGSPTTESFVNARFHHQATGRNHRLAAVLNEVIV